MGQLVRGLEEWLGIFRSALAYYVLYRPGCAILPRLAAFRDWLLNEAALYRTA